MKVVYLVRHGESKFNAEDRHQGWSSGNPLSPKGRSQAERIGTFLESHPIDSICASPLLRTRQTAQIISQHVDVPITITHSLIDYRRGKSQEGVYKKIYHSLPEYQHWLRNVHNRNFSLPDGESLNGFRRRIVRFAQKAEVSMKKDTVLLVTHQSPIQELILHWTGKHLDLAAITNCALYKIDLKSGKLKIVEY